MILSEYFKKNFKKFVQKRSNELKELNNEIVKSSQLTFIPVRDKKGVYYYPRCFKIESNLVNCEDDKNSDWNIFRYAKQIAEDFEKETKICEKSDGVLLSENPAFNFDKIKELNPSIEDDDLIADILMMVLNKGCDEKFVLRGERVYLKKNMLSLDDAIENYCNEHSSWTCDEIYDLMRKTDPNKKNKFTAIAKSSEHGIRIDNDTFLNKRNDDLKNFYASFSDVEKRINEIMNTKDYSILENFKDFILFPNISPLKWTEQLFVSYLRDYSKYFSFKRLDDSHETEKIAGVVVIGKNLEEYDFDQICSTILANSDIELNKKEVLDYLFDKKIITVRSYKNIDYVIRDALNLRKEGNS